MLSDRKLSGSTCGFAQKIVVEVILGIVLELIPNQVSF